MCHSLGGLVVKRALLYSCSLFNEKTEHLRSVYVSTFGILFLGTPHNGPDIAKWGLLLHNICTVVLPKKFMETSPQLVKALCTNNETLQHINSLFADIMNLFHIYFFYEKRSTDVHGTLEVIVDETSAAPYMEGVERIGIDADHSHMCKFEDENAPGYEVVAEAILRYSHQAPTVIADRWVEEKKTRALAEIPKNVETSYGRPDPSPWSDVRHTASHHSSKDLPLFITPPGFHPNASFFGMQKELEMLHDCLFKDRARADLTASVLISGVPGSGKTHLARQYVWTQRECYPGGVFWINAKSRESRRECFWKIAQAAGLIDYKNAEDAGDPEQYVSTVRNWLQMHQEWLLVFDGITFSRDDDISEFRPFLPWNSRCSIIYTSTDRTLQKKHRPFEPFCLSIPPLAAEDACKILYKDLGIEKPTKEQALRARELVEHYECLPLAIHAIGHRLRATNKQIETFHVKNQVMDVKLAQPFLSIMNDMLRLELLQALNLVHLLSFLGHRIPVGLLSFGRHSMSTDNAEIVTCAQAGEDPDVDTTLGTLIHYGLIERTSDAASFDVQSSASENSEEAFSTIYRGNSSFDTVKIHRVVQQFCRDELRIKDEECKDAATKE